MKPSLLEIQKSFQNYLLDKSPPIIEHIVSTPRISAKKRMDVYENAYRLRLIETLADNFIGLNGLAGDEQFDQLARQYIDAVPSSYKNIRWYGDKLAEFLSQNNPWRSQPVFAEMANADWHILLAFDAPDKTSIDENEIMALPTDAWTSLKFNFDPSLHQVNVNYNVFKFRKQFIAESENIQAPEKLENLTAWLIWRKQLQQFYRSMDVDEAWAMEQARSGANFPDLCEGLCEWIDAEHAAGRAAGFLKQWVSDGLIIQVEY